VRRNEAGSGGADVGKGGCDSVTSNSVELYFSAGGTGGAGIKGGEGTCAL
jgi:hypothetical protein